MNVVVLAVVVVVLAGDTLVYIMLNKKNIELIKREKRNEIQMEIKRHIYIYFNFRVLSYCVLLMPCQLLLV